MTAPGDVRPTIGPIARRPRSTDVRAHRHVSAILNRLKAIQVLAHQVLRPLVDGLGFR
jgi:hypothetical protein